MSSAPPAVPVQAVADLLSATLAAIGPLDVGDGDGVSLARTEIRSLLQHGVREDSLVRAALWLREHTPIPRREPVVTGLDSESWVCGRCGGQMIGHRPPDGLCRECHVLAVTAPACPGPHEPPAHGEDDCLAYDPGDADLLCWLAAGHDGDHYDVVDGHWRADYGRQRRITPCTRKDKP